VLESDRLREIECAVAVALKTHTAAREAESQKHAEQMNEMRQLLLKMSKSNETRETQSTADFEQKLVAAASMQYAEQLRVAQQLLLNLTKSNSAAAAPEVTAEQLEEAAEAQLTQLREIDTSARKIFEKVYSPPVTLPVFPETSGNLLAALNVFCATTGTKCLLMPEAARLQTFVDSASKILSRAEIDVRASQLSSLGARMSHGGVLSEEEATSVLVQSVRAAEERCSEAATAFVHAAAPTNTTMRMMLDRSVILQQGQPGIGPLHALAIVLEPYQAESKKTKADLLDNEANIKSCTFGKSATSQISVRDFRAKVAALVVAMSTYGMHSSLGDPEAEFSALCNAAGQSSLGQLFAQAHTIAKLSGGIVNYAALLHNADVIAHDEDRRVTRAAATKLSEHAVTPKSSDAKVVATTKAAANADAASKPTTAASKALKANAARSVRCFNCGAREHVSSLCPKPTPPDGQKICWTCGIVGHVATACPSKSSGDGPQKKP